MQPLKIVIADDEIEARKLLLHYLNGKDFQIKECTDGISVLKALQDFQPDIVFLDIKMPELTGIEVLQNKQDTLLPAVILTTAFDEYALSAFDYEVIDYLLKPFEKTRFDKALIRALDYVSFTHNKTKRHYLKQIAVKTGAKTELLNVEDIFLFKAEGPYVQVITQAKVHLITEPIYELASSLDPSEFARVHRSIIVRIDQIKSIQSLLNGDHLLLLKNGREIRASRTYKERIKSIQSF
jgi:two-component system, LytTR family, response regulator